MTRFKSKLLSLNANRSRALKVFSPANCEELRIPFKQDKVAKIVGTLAQIPPPAMPFRTKDQLGEAFATSENQLVTGVLVQNDFKMSLMAPEDLREYAGLTTTTITCRQRLKLSSAGTDLIRWALEGTFGSLQDLSPDKHTVNGKAKHVNGVKDGEEADEEITRDEWLAVFRVMDCVTVKCGARGDVAFEWEGNMINDGIADAILAVLFTVESSPAAVRRKFSSTSTLFCMLSYLIRLQIHRRHTITTTTLHLARILTQQSIRKHDSTGFVSSWKLNSARISLQSRHPARPTNSPHLRQKTKHHSQTWSGRRRRWRGYTAWAFQLRALKSALTKGWRRYGLRTSA
jgi:hypothetical protein